MARNDSPGFTAVATIVKVVAMVVGFVGTLVALMSLVGAFTGNGWIRFGVALVVAVAVPLAIADRLLPPDPAGSGAIVTDALSVIWLGVTFLFVVPLHGFTVESLTREGDRLRAGGWDILSRVTYALAGVADTSGTGREGAASTVASASANASSSSASVASPASASASAGPTPHVPSAAPSASAPAAKEEKTAADLFKELAPSVVTIFSRMDDRDVGSGTGFLVDSDGTIATNHHVIEHASRGRIKFMNGAVFEKIDVLADDSARDLALLRVDLKAPVDGGAPNVTALKLGDSDQVVVGERAISIGNPLGLEHTLTDGLVSARRMYEGRPWIQMSVPVSPGNSGGPIFNMRGEVIGITTQQVMGGLFGRAQNLNLAVPVNDLKKMIAPNYPGRRALGDGERSGRW